MSGTVVKRCVTLPELAERLRTTDLVPSQRPLLDGIDERLAQLAAAGITSVADLRARLESMSAVPAVATVSGVDEDYLVLLRRAVRGFYPRPRPLRTFEWISSESIAALASAGIANSEQLRLATCSGPAQLAERSGVAAATIAELGELADLVRVQWINPTLARALIAAGYPSASAIATADPTELARALAAANRRRRFFDATIGERDLGRMIDAAGYAD